MTSILYWNIENFGVNKVQNPSTDRSKGSRKSKVDASADRFAYILQHINQCDPDIFIIVEVETPYNDDRGTLCGGAGEEGLAVIYNTLRGLNVNWALVPALKTGVKESVGVFFREDRVTFTGPKLWAGGNGPTNDAVTNATASDYTAAGWPTLSGTAVPAGSAFNPGAQQNHCAAAVEFRGPPVMGAPGAYEDFGDIRSPYQTTFWDGARNINIFTVHSPAYFAGATAFLQGVSQLDEVSTAMRVNEIRLVLGDFNLNALTPMAAYSGCYAPLTGLGYAVGLLPGAAAGAPASSYRSYYATHIRPKRLAQCWCSDDYTFYYPGYGYRGDNSGTASNDSIDNVLWRAAGGMAVAPQVTVINGLVGSPYRAYAGGAPNLGTQAFVTDIDWWCAGENPQDPDPPDVGVSFNDWRGICSWFRGWDVYGRTRSVSDHLPLFIVV